MLKQNIVTQPNEQNVTEAEGIMDGVTGGDKVSGGLEMHHGPVLNPSDVRVAMNDGTIITQRSPLSDI